MSVVGRRFLLVIILMFELGQFMHVFDLAEINGGVRVCMVEEGEKLVLFDG